tara:strand:- start:1298 stop:1726 length:429 start_codon:yes stop_codon:yes gene_type:complete
MFAKIDDSKFPLVYYTLNGIPESDNEFENFLIEWDKINNRKQYYNLCINSLNIGWISVKYAIRLSKYVKKLKENEEVYIRNTIIIIQNKYVRGLINLVFKLQKPVSTIYIVNNIKDSEIVNYCISKNIKINTDKITIINKKD